MATLETQPYQTHQDDQESPVILYLGELPILVFPDLVRAFLHAQVPFLNRVALDPKAKTLKFAFKAAARLAMDLYVMPKAKRGEMPMPDPVAMREDIVAYTLLYWSDLVLMGLQSTPWEILYVEHEDGAIEITGMAPTVQAPTDAGEPGGTSEAPGAAIAGPSADEHAPEPDRSAPGGPMAGGRDIGQRENDMGESPAAESLETVA